MVSKYIKEKLSRERSFNGTPAQKGWFNHSCTKALTNLKQALKASPRNPNLIISLRRNYKLTLNTRKNELKMQAWEKLEKAASINDMRAFWRIINNPLFNNWDLPNLEINIPQEAWVLHFGKLYESIDDPKSCSLNTLAPLGGSLPYNLDFDLEEVSKAIKACVNNKAPGPDGVPADLFKSNIEFWAPLITNVLKAVSSVGKIPTRSQAVIIPIFKKGNREDPACYRPISLLDSLVKILGRVLLQRLDSGSLTPSHPVIFNMASERVLVLLSNVSIS